MNCAVYDWRKFQRIYAGCSGSGKTTLFWEHWKQEKARAKFLFDHKLGGEFTHRYKLKACYDWDTLLAEIKRVIDTERGGVVTFVPNLLYPGRPSVAFEIWCELIFSICQKFKGRKLIGADELQTLQGVHSQPKALLDIADIGRTAQMDCLFAASGLNRMHTDVKNQITEVYAFRQKTKNACKWLVEEFGYDELELLNLKKGCWLWRDDTGEAKAGGKAF